MTPLTTTCCSSAQKVYVTLFPCGECAKLLIQAGIKEVIYHEGKLPEDRVPPVASSVGRLGEGSPLSRPHIDGLSGAAAQQPPTPTAACSNVAMGCSDSASALTAEGGSCASGLQSNVAGSGRQAEAPPGEPPGSAAPSSAAAAGAADSSTLMSDLAYFAAGGNPSLAPSSRAGGGGSGGEVTDPTYLASMKLLTLAGVRLRQHRLVVPIQIFPH